jgi:predicted Zn-dependent protease
MGMNKAGVNKTVLVRILAVALLLLPAIAQKRTPSGPQTEIVPDALQEAEELLQKQQYDKAEVKLTPLVKTHAGNPQAWFDLGYAQSHQGKSTDAVAAYSKAVELNPKWFEASLNLALALAKSGQSSQAVAVLKNTIQLQPATGGNQALSGAWQLLAQVLAPTDPKASAAAAHKACELDPSSLSCSAEAPVTIDSSLPREKRLAQAEELLRKHLARNPRDLTAQVQLSQVLADEGKLPEAIANLEAANVPSDPSVTRQLAELYNDNKQYDKAVPLFQQLLASNAADPQLYMGLGVALEHQLKFAEAEAELLQAVQRKGDLANAYYELAYVAQQNKHYELCLRALEARAKYLPEVAGTYWLRAVALDSLHAYKPAAENYRLFLSTSAGRAPDEEFKARHRLKAIEPQ